MTPKPDSRLMFKTENGIRYHIEARPDAGLTEPYQYWVGEDGSILELTDAESAERDKSRSIVD